MVKTFRQAFRVKCTYRANSLLYALKQIPILKKMIPQAAYSVPVLKVLAVIAFAIWEIGVTFVTKAAYLGLIVLFPALSVANLHELRFTASQVFLHMLVLLTAAGGLINNRLLNSTKLAHYTVSLLRMDAKRFTLSDFAYQQLRFLIGFLPFTVLFGRLADVPLWFCLLLPFTVVGSKLIGGAFELFCEKRFGIVPEEGKMAFLMTAVSLVLLCGAFIPPLLGFVIPQAVSTGILLAMIPLGILCVRPITAFSSLGYKTLTNRLQVNALNQMNNAKVNVKKNAEKNISADPNVTSSRSGFEFLNELFVKRHSKILWSTTEKIAMVLGAVLAGVLIVVLRFPDARPGINAFLMTKLPLLWLVLYALNRGMSFTQACYMNCDHALLTYPFFKKPGSILRLFRIRLREISKINAVPAAILGCGAALLLALSGGTDNPLNYAILIIATLAVSMFFSIHYLMLYYLFQPYTVGSEMRGGPYSFISGGTYFVCYMLMQVKLPTLMFGLMCILFCVCYCLIAYALVYKFAPRTFKLRS